MPTGRHLLAWTGAGTLLAAAALLPAVATAEPTFTSDEQGYVGTEAYCDSTQLAVAFGRTSRSLVAICTVPAGGYEYRGVRISDEAGLKAVAKAVDGGFVIENEGATYTVSPQQLLVTSEDKVVYRDTWLEYEQPRFTAEGSLTPTTSGSASPTTTSTPTISIPTATVTVTVTAEPTG